MLKRASAQLYKEGLTVGLDTIKMENIIKAAGVSRASAYRLWPTRNDFLAETLVTALRQVKLIPEREQDVQDLLVLIQQNYAQLSDEQGRRNLVVEALRQSVDSDVRRLLAAPEWRLFLALSVTYQTLPDAGLRERIGSELAQLEQEFIDNRATIYEGLAQLIGYQQQAPWDARAGFISLSEQAGTVMRGIQSRAIAEPNWLDRRAEQALFGSSISAPWSQAEITLVGVLLGHLTPDPEIVWDAERIAQAEEMFVQLWSQL